jgi:hypothetical protein
VSHLFLSSKERQYIGLIPKLARELARADTRISESCLVIKEVRLERKL